MGSKSSRSLVPRCIIGLNSPKVISVKSYLHLNGKTIGPQSFSLGPVRRRTDRCRRLGDPAVRVERSDPSNRRTGGQTQHWHPAENRVTPKRVGNRSPRHGRQVQGALAFRLLQRDWNLVLGIEKLDPWVTGQVLHEVTLREGQTRSALIADLQCAKRLDPYPAGRAADNRRGRNQNASRQRQHG